MKASVFKQMHCMNSMVGNSKPSMTNFLSEQQESEFYTVISWTEQVLDKRGMCLVITIK